MPFIGFLLLVASIVLMLTARMTAPFLGLPDSGPDVVGHLTLAAILCFITGAAIRLLWRE